MDDFSWIVWAKEGKWRLSDRGIVAAAKALGHDNDSPSQAAIYLQRLGFDVSLLDMVRQQEVTISSC